MSSAKKFEPLNNFKNLDEYFVTGLSLNEIVHLFGEMLNRSQYAIFCYDIKKGFELIYFSSTAQELWNLDLNKKLGTKLVDHIGEIFPHELSNFIQEQMKEPPAPNRKVCELALPSGLYLKSQIEFLRSQHNEIQYMIVMARDISEKKAYQARVAELYSKYERTLKNIPGVVYQFKMNPQGEFAFTFISDQFSDLFGYKTQDLLSSNEIMYRIIPKESHEIVTDLMKISGSLLLPYKWEGWMITKSGESKWILMQSVPQKQSDDVIFWEGIMTDLTEQKSLQKTLEEERVRLIESSKLSELGKMAGGIAHEINNPIFAIRLSAENILRSLEDEHVSVKTVREACQAIINVSDRITTIVKGLRQFSRDGSQDPMVSISVKQLIGDTLALCQQKFKSRGIELKIPALDEFLLTECRPIQISQVLINLINNSYDAIKDTDDAWVSVEVYEKLDNIEFSVTDSGPGIPTEVASKIMQPFFTTKPIGEGTGLGLSISDSIIRNHAGQFWIDTRSKNTKFCFSIPKIQKSE